MRNKSMFVRIEADVHLPQVVERPQKQAGADQQHQRYRYLHDQQRLLSRLRDPATLRLLSFNARADVDVRCAQRRLQCRRGCRSAGDAGEERSDPPVERRRLARGDGSKLLTQ